MKSNTSMIYQENLKENHVRNQFCSHNMIVTKTDGGKSKLKMGFVIPRWLLQRQIEVEKMVGKIFAKYM